MNVIVADRKIDELQTLDIDLLKSVKGVYPVEEIILMFKDFFFNKMILDITAIKDYSDISNIEKLSQSLDPNKIIFYLPSDPIVTSQEFLSKLVKMGIYNFTAKIEGVKYLLGHTNTYDDVAYITAKDTNLETDSGENKKTKIIGVKNITEHSGATTLIYMMHKECKNRNLKSYALEINKNDFRFYNDIYMISTNKESVNKELEKLKDADVIFIDLNDNPNSEICNDVIYILEASVLKLNKLMYRDKKIFEKLKNNKIILNQNLLDEDRIHDLEYESKIKFFHYLPPIDDRLKSDSIINLLIKLNIISNSNNENDGEEKKDSGINKLFGLFKKD